jgi:hypothetical protein
MQYFTEQRAIRRHGRTFERVRDILSLAMLAAEAEGRGGPTLARDVVRSAAWLPWAGMLDRGDLREAGRSAARALAERGIEGSLMAAADRLDDHDACAALLLVCDVAPAAATGDRSVLRAIARRLGVADDRLRAIELLAARRRGVGGAAS